MNIGNKIKEYRNICNLSQEELADKIFVTRQTISNWENNKYYPDIKSISLLYNIFNVSLEIFIEKDLGEMKKVIETNDIKGFDILSWIFTIELIIMLISVYPLFKFIGLIGVPFWILFTIITMVTALAIERFKKHYDIQTYKEIIAFCENKTLSRDEKNQEIGKRPYQKFLLVLSSSLVAIIILIIIKLLFN